jgi:hypothetical protein
MIVECSDNVLNRQGVPAIVKEHLESFGLKPASKVVLNIIKYTGIKMKQPIMFKNLDTTSGFKSLLYYVRPIGRSTGTLVSISSSNVDINDIAKKEQAEAIKEHEPDKARPVAGEELFDSQIYPGRVVAHEEHGMLLDVCGNRAWVPLSDFSEDYDQKSMKAYRIGKTIPKVLVCDSTADPILCSLNAEAMLETTHSKDTFTGALTPNGALPLTGFLYDHKRVFDLIYSLAIASVDDAYFMATDVAYEEVTKYLKGKYGATIIEQKNVGIILSKLLKPLRVIPEPVLERRDGGFVITQFAIKESGADSGSIVKEKVGLVEIAKSQVGLVHHEDATEADSDPFLPPKAPSDVPVPAKKADKVSLHEFSTYYAKLSRLVHVRCEIDSLEHESRELEEWLANNVSIKEAATDCKALLDELLVRVASGK